MTTWAEAIPTDPEPWKRLGYLHRERGRTSAAIDAYQQAWQRAPDDAELRTTLRDVAFDAGMLDLAAAVAKAQFDAATTPREVALAHFTAFRIARARGDDDALLEHGDHYFPLASRYPGTISRDDELHYFAALLARGRQRTLEAHVRTKANARNPERQGTALARRLATFDGWRPTTDPQRVEEERMLGDTYADLHRPDLALPHYEAAAVRLEPNAETLARLADARGRTGDVAGSDEAFRQAIALDPRHVVAYGDHLLATGRITELEGLHAEVTERDETLGWVLEVRLAQALLADGNEDRAVAWLITLTTEKRYEAADGASARAASRNRLLAKADAALVLARRHDDRGDHGEAIRWYQRADNPILHRTGMVEYYEWAARSERIQTRIRQLRSRAPRVSSSPER